MQAGHALIGALMPEYDPVQKISIVPRGSAGGLTFFAPSEDRLESGLYRFVRTSQNSNREVCLRRIHCPFRGSVVYVPHCMLHQLADC